MTAGKSAAPGAGDAGAAEVAMQERRVHAILPAEARAIKGVDDVDR